MHEVRVKSSLLVGLFGIWRTPEWVGDITGSLLAFSATINFWGEAQSIKGFATMKNVVNLQFASEMTPKVVRNISKLVLRKSRLHKLHAFMEKKWGTGMCLTITVITGDFCSKSDSIEEDRGSGTVVFVACRRLSDSVWAIDCQQGEARRSYRGFVKVHCSSSSFVWKSRCFYTLFVLRIIAFHVITY